MFFAATISQEQIIEVVKQHSAILKAIPDEAYRAALESLRGTKTLRKLIEMADKVKKFEELVNTPVLTNFNNVYEFRKFKELIKDKLNPLNWLLDIVTPKWVSFVSDTKEVFSAVREDILEKALKESLYQKYKSARDSGADMNQAYDEKTQAGGFSIIRSSAEYKNLPDQKVHELLKRALEERYMAEKYAEFIQDLTTNKQKYISQIMREYNDHIVTLMEKAEELAKQIIADLSGEWTVSDSAGRFNGTMKLSRISYTTLIGGMETPGGRINVYGEIKGNTVELGFHFYSEALIDQYLRYPELSRYIASRGGVMATIVLTIDKDTDFLSGTLYPWYVVYNDTDGLVVKEIVYGTPEQSGTPRSISMSRVRR